jgi:cell division protein FtsL
MEMQKEASDNMLEQERLQLQQNALADKTRVAQDRIQTQRDIASMNAQIKRNSQ